MRTFPHFNPTNNNLCPVCRTADDRETVLVPIAGTASGHNCEATQVHLACITDNWFYYEDLNLIGIGCLEK